MHNHLSRYLSSDPGSVVSKITHLILPPQATFPTDLQLLNSRPASQRKTEDSQSDKVCWSNGELMHAELSRMVAIRFNPLASQMRRTGPLWSPNHAPANLCSQEKDSTSCHFTVTKDGDICEAPVTLLLTFAGRKRHAEWLSPLAWTSQRRS